MSDNVATTPVRSVTTTIQQPTLVTIVEKLIEALPPTFIVLVVFLGIVFYHEGDLTTKRTIAIEKILVSCIERSKN